MNSQILLAGFFTILGAAIGGGFGLWQAHIQNKNQIILTRAIDIENRRPRFSFATTSEPTNSPKLDLPFALLFKNLLNADPVEVANSSHIPPKIFVKNISDNNLYDFEISITYHFENSKREFHELFNYSGLAKKESVMLIPDTFSDKNLTNIYYDSVLTRFLTTAGERGYTVCHPTKNPGRIGAAKYYFVRDQNKMVTSQAMGNMLFQNDPYLKHLNHLIETGGKNIDTNDTDDGTWAIIKH